MKTTTAVFLDANYWYVSKWRANFDINKSTTYFTKFGKLRQFKFDIS